MPATQDNRPIRIDTPLGKDILLLHKFTVREELGRPFEIEAELQSDHLDRVDPGKIINQKVTITVNLADGSKRYFNGFVSRFGQFGFRDAFGFRNYRCTIEPGIALLKHTTDCRTFVEKSIPDIIIQILKEHGIEYNDDSLHDADHDYEPRWFTVQYNESTFGFVSRLLEFAGIYYHFQHTVDGHILILNDTSVSDHFHYNEASKKVIYNPDQLHPGTLHEWSTNIYSGTTSFSLSDYDYTSPKSLMQTEPLSPPSKFARYEGTGGYYSDKENPVKYGAYYAKLRLEEQTCRQSIQKGMGDLLVIGAGFTFTPIGPMGEKEYLTISMTLTVTAAKWSSENQPREFKEVVCDLEAIPKEVSFRPTRITPKPLITGIQSAMVVGPAGQDPKTPYCSPLGSIKVQFPWDRYNQNGIDQEGQLTSSNWVRVSQISAGNGWGSMFIPRVGNEVLVAFENGDPDKPVVIGNVYNGYNQPPVPPSSNSVLCYISDDSGNYIVWSPISGQESLVLYSPNGDTTHSIGYSTS